MNNLYNQLNPNPIKQIMNNPEFRQQINSMYQLYRGNPNAFIQQYINKYPQLNNLLQGNVSQTLNNMLINYGISPQDFKNLFN